MSKKWNRDAFYRLLRFGRKNEGGWTDIDIEWQDGETMPDDDDIDLLMAAPLMYEAIEVALRSVARNYNRELAISDDAHSMLRAALHAAKGGDGDGK